METMTLKIDTAFRGNADIDLVNALNLGWKIYDKTAIGERYIYYVLSKGDSDVGRTSGSAPTT